MTLANEDRMDHARRFGGLSRLYGVQGASQIFNSHIVIVGIGGVGSWSAEALARSGVGRITLIDMDHVSESNINRQIHSLDSTLGQSKIEAMRERMTDINPDCLVHCVDEFVSPENWTTLVEKISQFAPIHGLIDACDQVQAKTALAAWALGRKLYFITVGAAGGKQQAELVQIDDLSSTTHDPLLAKMRYNLRRQHNAARVGRMGVACVYSKESVQSPQQDLCEVEVSDSVTDSSLNCHGFGSCVSVTATFGMCASGWMTKVLAKTKRIAL